MLSPKYIRENVEKVEETTESKGYKKELVGQWLKVDQQWRDLLGQVEELRAERNKLN